MCTFHVRQRRQRGWMIVAEKVCQHPVRCSVGNACCAAAGSVVLILAPQGVSQKHTPVSASAMRGVALHVRGHEVLVMIMMCLRETGACQDVLRAHPPSSCTASLGWAFAVALGHMHSHARTHSQGFCSSLPLQCLPLCRARTSR